MDIPEVIFPGAQSESQLQRRFEPEQEKKPGEAPGPPRPKVGGVLWEYVWQYSVQVPNIYVKKPHRKQPALGLFLAKADPADREDWRLTTGNSKDMYCVLNNDDMDMCVCRR